jgi:type VI secretion system secreted protein VgrG
MVDVHHKVKFSFSSQGEPGTHWRVVRLHGREALSEPFDVVLDLANEDLTADPGALLGQGALLEITRDAQTRNVVGVARRVEHHGTTAGHLLCRVHLAPALLALAQRVNSRIFQEMKVPDIVKKVLDAGLSPFSRTVRLDLTREYPVREYCVQHRESDLDFVQRLLAEEGIGYCFDFSDPAAETLVLFDAFEPLGDVLTLDAGPVPIVGDGGGTMAVETVRHFEQNRQINSTSVVVRDFDWTQPTLDLTRESRGTDPNGMDREVFEYPAGLTIGEYSNPRYTAEDGAVQSRLRREGHAQGDRTFRGDGYVTGFAAGMRFELEGHGDAALDAKYVLTRVEHEGFAPEEITSDANDTAAQERYRNTFTCAAEDVVFRPARVYPKPKVGGVQTATVTGPAGEEIYTDEHGRIKVQFHWDREGARDEKSSCWVRVMQPWAGAGWGFVWIPRIGMEVVVQFLEGDPDRPLVTGCVYNGQNTPPYALPDEKTKSTIKSNSSPGGGGSNEIRFEDLAGAEEIYLHAQKDFNEVVEHDHTTRVKNHHTNTVDVNDTESVGGDQTLTVSGNRTKTVKKDEKTTVEQNRTEVVNIDETITVHGNRTEAVDGDESITIGGNRTATVGGDESTSVGGDQKQSVGGDRTASVDGDQTTTVGGDDALDVAGDRSAKVGGDDALEVSGDLSADVGGDATLKTGGDINASAGGDVNVDASANVTIAAGSEGVFQGATISVSGSGEVTISGGGSTIKLSGAGVEINGATVKIAGGMVEVTGGLVKIN